MLGNFSYRIGNRLALLAAAVFVFWPGLVRGNCCCEAAHPLSAIIAGADCAQSESCCATTEPATHSPSCCPSSAAGPTGRDGETQDHQCGVSCCQSLTALAVKSVPPNQIGTAAGLPVEACFEFPGGVSIVSNEPPELPLRSLPAQEHCAQICRWLK